MYACIYTRMSGYIVRGYVDAGIYVHISVYMQTCVFVYQFVRIRTYEHYACEYIYIVIHIYIYTYKYMYVYTYTNAISYMYMYTCIYTYIQVYAYMYMYT